jgi:hypothetical protein
MDEPPRTAYERRLALRQATVERLAQQDRAYGNWRLLVFACGLLTAWLAWGAHLLSPWWLLLPIGVFLALAARHDAVIQARRRAERAAAHYRLGLLRLDGLWHGQGSTGSRFLDAEHPYAGDLDLFGRGSLFELLCIARTRAGEERLATWLRAPADAATVRERQVAVQELAPRLDLREDLVTQGEQVRTAVPVDDLAAWGALPPGFLDRNARLLLPSFAVLTVAALAAWAAGAGLAPFFAVQFVVQTYGWTLRRRVRDAIRGLERLARDLEMLTLLLARLEREPCEAPLLQALHSRLKGEGLPASTRLAQLQRRVELLEVPHNQFLRLPCAALLWTPQCALAIEAWRAANGPHIGSWLRTIGEFEALCAIAGFAWENPENGFPEIVEEGPMLEAHGLAHPLLPATAVRNDVRLGSDLRLLIVSGSNMSGKSTLLRAVGVNVALALAGAPVRARGMRLSCLNMGASIRTQDSLQEGISRFYAEILRLRQIVGLADAGLPLLFLLDEILHGTNSHDRRVGAEAVLRALVIRNAVGLVTTHDLALARIADESALHAVNVHFEDQLTDGKMTFDYCLRSGMVTKSNAIELMRAVGLEV